MSKSTYWKTPDDAVYEMPGDWTPYSRDWEQLPQKVGKAAYRADRIAYLRTLFPPGAKVFCTVTNVARSGMSRSIRAFAMIPGDETHGPEPRDMSDAVAAVIGERSVKGGVLMGGCGMDMGFALTYALSHALYPDGFGLRPDEFKGVEFKGKRRPRTPAEAAKMIAQGYTFRGRNGDTSGWDPDGGYALRKEWL